VTVAMVSWHPSNGCCARSVDNFRPHLTARQTTAATAVATGLSTVASNHPFGRLFRAEMLQYSKSQLFDRIYAYLTLLMLFPCSANPWDDCRVATVKFGCFFLAQRTKNTGNRQTCQRFVGAGSKWPPSRLLAVNPAAGSGPRSLALIAMPYTTTLFSGRSRVCSRSREVSTI
jgi:hypothetical protein